MQLEREEKNKQNLLNNISQLRAQQEKIAENKQLSQQQFQDKHLENGEKVLALSRELDEREQAIESMKVTLKYINERGQVGLEQATMETERNLN